MPGPIVRRSHELASSGPSGLLEALVAASQQLLPEEKIDFGEPVVLGVTAESLKLIATVGILFIIDVFLFSKLEHRIRNHLAITLFWITAGAAFNVHIYKAYGEVPALYWFSGYMLEWVLSLDNLIVFSLIFTTYRTPPSLVHKALYFGILGCIMLRLGLFNIASAGLKQSERLQVILGVLLMISGGQGMFDEDEGDDEFVDTFAVRITKAFMGSRLEHRYDLQEGRLFVVRDGRLRATLLVFVIVLLEICDVMFALDSISAKIASVPNQYIAFSSTVMAIFGLRAAFFLVHHLVQEVDSLKYGVAFIVAYIGAQLILSKWRYFPEWSTCAVSAFVLIMCILVAAYQKARRPAKHRT
eukprot:TRINITY_DN14179_c0_g1_i1.p1 TRINITY_DN14179_c0_g1~~TRINITY_DN14179_c0_g1_i1.p1  ORF type:complete len:357 (-),score=48.43 TRINITY_DN14179_c0_g1_i1:7-1077(-)